MEELYRFWKVRTKYWIIQDDLIRNAKYHSLLSALGKYEGRLTGDKKSISDYLISLVKNELWIRAGQ